MDPADSSRNEDQATRALTREVGRRSVERLGDGLGRVQAESAALLRWLLSALILFNLLGFLFCFAFPAAIAAPHHDALVSLFAIGAVTALLAALASLLLAIPLAGAMRQAVAHWTEVSVSGAASVEALGQARRVKLAGLLRLGVTVALALLSLGLFVAGARIASDDFAALDRALGFRPAAGARPPAPEETPAPRPEPAASAVAPVRSSSTETPAPARATSPRGQASPAATPSPRPTSRPTPPPRPVASATSRPSPRPSPSATATARAPAAASAPPASAPPALAPIATPPTGEP